MSQSIKEQAARVLGMKVREVVAVDDHGHYAVITTHDSTRTVVNADGVVGPYSAELVASLDDGQAAAPEQAVAAEVHDDGNDGSDGAAGEMPTGTVEVVLAWVGQDADRAQQALAAENAAEKPRNGLIDKLQKVVDA